MSVKILAVGDVCGEPGLDYLEKNLRNYRKENGIDFVVVNGENANVVGVTPRQADAIFRAGADVITLGNHTWTRTELRPYLDERSRILRPANFAPQCPGRGIGVFKTAFGDVCVLNLIGRFTLDSNTDNPFVIADGYMEEIKEKIILVDFHAEGTSEKRAMGFMLDGRASAVSAIRFPQKKHQITGNSTHSDSNSHRYAAQARVPIRLYLPVPPRIKSRPHGNTVSVSPAYRK